MSIRKPPQPPSFMATLRGLTPGLARAVDAVEQAQAASARAQVMAKASAGAAQALVERAAAPLTRRPGQLPVRAAPKVASDFAAADQAPARTGTPAAHVPTGHTHQMSQRMSHPAGVQASSTLPKLSDEQMAVVRNYSPQLVVQARAGTGKTTTAVAYTEVRRNKRILYMPFNRANREDARRRMGTHVATETGHSVALSMLGGHYRNRVPDEWRAFTVREEMGLRSARAAAHVQCVLNNFFVSADDELEYKHALSLADSHRASDREMGEALTSARVLWRRMQDTNDRVSVPHDAYLKIWALCKPKLPYDVVMIDEYQDTNAVMERVMEQQTHATRVYIGDEHQSIYAFRGAVTAMQNLKDKGTHLTLSQSWRFGPIVAERANVLLRELKGETLVIQGMGQDVPYQAGSSVTKLARTNAHLFEEAVHLRGQGIHWVGGVGRYQLHKLTDACHLMTGRREQIRDPFIRNFTSFGEMKDYAEQAGEAETRIMVKVIEEFGHDTPALVAEITKNEVKDAAHASTILTTAHRSKGLDWDYVELCNDFEFLMKAEADLAADPFAAVDQQEVNLLYVALTRAKKALQPNQEYSDWCEKLPQFRRARELARARVAPRMRP